MMALLISLLPMLLTAAVLLTLSALFSVSESALLAMNKLRLRVRCKSGDLRALRVARLLKQKNELINSLLAANCLVNILLSSLMAKTAMAVWGNAGLSAAAVITAVILLVFGEITPKTLAARHAERIAYSLSLFVSLTVAVFRPVAKAFTFAADRVLAAFGVNKISARRSYTEDDIKTVISEGANNGAIDKNESAMAQGVFRFTDLEAQDIMVPRKNIAAIEENTAQSAILSLFSVTGHSRFPVYKGTIDNITGVLYIKDLINAKKNASIKDVMRSPLFILGIKKMSSIQAMLQKNRQSMAIVVDEYSGTEGILTITDITERIFSITADAVNKKLSSFAASGTALITELSEELNIPIQSDMNETIGGWVTEKLGDLPKTGDKVEYLGYCFCVEKTDGKSIDTIRVEKANSAPNKEQN